MNKVALFFESISLQDFMVGLDIDGYISKRGKGKSALYFVRKNFIDSSSHEKNENSNNGMSLQQNLPFSPPQTIEKARKDIENEKIELENIQKTTPLQIIMTLHNLVTTKRKLRMSI